MDLRCYKWYVRCFVCVIYCDYVYPHGFLCGKKKGTHSLYEVFCFGILCKFDWIWNVCSFLIDIRRLSLWWICHCWNYLLNKMKTPGVIAFSREVREVGICHDSAGYAKTASEAGPEAKVSAIRQERGTQWLTSGPRSQREWQWTQTEWGPKRHVNEHVPLIEIQTLKLQFLPPHWNSSDSCPFLAKSTSDSSSAILAHHNWYSEQVDSRPNFFHRHGDSL